MRFGPSFQFWFCCILRYTAVACIKCNNNIPRDEQCYFVSDLGPELLYIIEEHVSNEMPEDAVICHSCFGVITDALTNTSNVSPELAIQNETNSCVWCLLSLSRRRTHDLPIGPQRNVITTRISPRQIPDGGRVCYRCWVQACRLSGHTSTSDQSENLCVWCRCSLTLRRTHIISIGPERNEIATRISPRQILPGDRVCHSCYMSARRNVYRSNNPEEYSRSRACLVCANSLTRRHTHLLTSAPIRDIIARRIHPRQITNHALVCDECWTWAQAAVLDNTSPLNEEYEDQPQVPIQQSIQLNTYKKVGMSSASCFVPHCMNSERHAVPGYLRKNILQSNKVYIAENARICVAHKSTYNWDNIFSEMDNFNTVFNNDEIEKMLSLNKSTQYVHLNFSRFEDIDDDYFKYWTGLTKAQFVVMLEEVPQLTQSCKIPKTALGLYLVKVRTGEPHRRLATLFKFSTAKVVRLLKKVTNVLLNYYVPKYVGLNHISREQIINRNLLIPEGLFGSRENRKPIVIFDGTYIYIQKSSNYHFQKLTYSLHKYRNLVKPFLVVATDGHIVDVCGPYPATMSDATIMTLLFRGENGPYRQYFRPGDVFILDRGFRDALPLLNDIYKVCKPESLDAGETQLSTIKANKSRLVTLCWWVVEVVNGYFKLQFKLFRHEYFNTAVPHLMDDFKICAAVLNAFHSTLVDRPDAELILNRALQRVNLPNVLGEYVVQNNINRRRVSFENINANHPLLDVFPQMTMSNLILFALGVYQIKQARSYYGEHIRRNGSFVVEVCSETMAPGIMSSHASILIRGRIKSRHHGNKVYYSYILTKAEEANSWDESIQQYYCSCMCGMRTVGCCAHVMTIVWFLGWARHQSNVMEPAPFLDNVLIREEE